MDANLVLLLRETAQQAQELELDTATRAELDDMLQRIERQFRNEQTARKCEEDAELLAAAELVQERESRVRLELELARRSEAPNTDALRSSLLADFAAIEEERRAVDADLAVARLEATKSTAFLADQEAQARHVESRERLRLEGEHSARMSKLSAELEAVREELDIRTRVIAGELARWRAQAEAAASAVRDAKDELRDRQREVDLTKGRMDGLVELLYLGRERTVELTRAIEGHLERETLRNNSAQTLASPMKQAVRQ